jgi:biopolymer transport protein ExbB
MGQVETEETGSTMTIPTHPLEVAEAMGWLFVIPFVVASVIAVWISIERLVVLRRSRVIPKPFVERFLLHLQEGRLTPKEALELCESNGSAVAAVFAHGVRKWGKPSVEVEKAIIDGGERQVAQLRNHLRVLNSVATLSPLIGLLGTVIGMIQSFNVIAQADASTRSEQLAIGIGLALLTTAVGLLIAIPALTMYIFLAGRVDARVMEMDELAQRVVHLISAEALESDAASAPRPRTRRPSAAQGGEASEKKAV